MRVRTRHPRLSGVACKVYLVVIWFYPAEFRRAFGHELVVTFRNRVEDVLDSGGIIKWLAFAVHIAVDWMRTCWMLMTESRTHDSVSLLGLGQDDVALGGIDRVGVDMSLVFAVAGLVLAFVGWYAYLAVLPSYVV
jgi:hypothetical protein